MSHLRKVAIVMKHHLAASARKVGSAYELGLLGGNSRNRRDSIEFIGNPMYQGRERPIAMGIPDNQFKMLERSCDYRTLYRMGDGK